MKNFYRNRLLFLIFFLASLVSWGQDSYPFHNPDLPLSQRVDDLIQRLTLEEKIGQLMFDAAAIPRLDVPKYNWWNECLHGVARNGRATVFPQAIGLGATFDPDLMHRIGMAIADEARAKFNANRKVGYRERYAGLTFWSPNVNLFRDPRWGRGQETYGEDPHLISELGVAFVRGLQGDDPRYLKTAAMAKHYAVHSGPEKLRHEFDAIVSSYDLWNTYLPAFRALVVDAEVEGVMGAYNRTNGDVCCAHPYLMQEVLRKQWKFDGYYVSDCWALQDFFQGHNIVKTREEAAALAINTGCNLNCGSTYPALLDAVTQGLVKESEIDANLKQLLPTRFELGLFDPMGSVPFDTISTKVVRSQDHLALAYEAAAKSLVLLKNSDQALPLDPNIESVFVTGPMAAHAQTLLANYYGVSDDLKTILEGIVANVSDHTAIRYVQGALMDRPNVNPMDWFSDEAREAEVTIACMGISQLLEGEEGEAIASPSAGDRDYINLPPHQIEFLKLLRSKAKKLIVVMTGGSAISSPEVHELADAIIYAWYPGERGGEAVGDLIFGKINASGKLPVTFVQDISQLPAFENYDMKGRTYRYPSKPPLYPFGFGLSYSNISFRLLPLESTHLSKTEKLTIEVELQNTGTVDVEEVVQLYIENMERTDQEPKFNLRDFQRITVPAGQTKRITFGVDGGVIGQFDETGNWVVPAGLYRLHIGGASPGQRSADLGAPEGISLDINYQP